LVTAWEQAKTRNLVLNLRRRNPILSDELFANYFDRIKDDLPYTLEEYRILRAAADGPLSTFQKALDSLHPGESAERRERRERNAFERRERTALYAEWKKGEVAGKLQEKLEEHALALMTSLGSSIGQIVPKLLLFPMQLFTALLLSFLITIDVPRLRAGLEKLSHTRFRHVYWEIKPGLVSFGLLIGRAFQAQGLIAVVNAVLTWIAIHFLGIQNAAFLCFIVFLCSFVPVLGVVFSSVPIAIMAITQDGGSLALALWSIAAILFIHFLETSIFNPRIVGNMLHLHPVLVLAILAICEHFFGVWGLLLGVPVFVYIIRFVILQEGIPGFLEMKRDTVGGDVDEEQ
jgi:predicted PurR-regulated permease PerM